jgi:beta-xylosidase
VSPLHRPNVAFAVALAGVLVVTACQQSSPGGRSGSTTTTEAQPASGFTNPVWGSNFPDPQIVKGPGGYVAMATNGNGMNVQTLTSDDLVDWTQGQDALPELPAWTSPGKVWAPEAARIADRWVMYYTTKAPDPEIQCIGVAVAAQPEGPYRDTSAGPLVCEEEQGGSIDASPFVAKDGRAYLYWKNDGNAIGVDTWISVQQLGPDGTTLVGRPQRLLKQDQPWEGQLVEAPSLWERDGVVHLFYSANDYGSDRYAVGHATAPSPLGPFTKEPEPVLVSSEVAAGPGHNSLVEKDGRLWMVYHAWAPDAVGSEVPGRTMWLSEVTFDGAKVRVQPPTTNVDTRP